MARPRIAPLNSKMYFTGKPCKNGHISQRYTSNNECVECKKQKRCSAKEKEKRKIWYTNNQERIKNLARQRYKNDIENQRERSRLKWKLNPEKVKAVNLAWAKKNPDKVKLLNRIRNATRRLVIKQQCPKWADKEKIKEIYMNRPESYHVDHIIPLRGKLVSGLHVSENLQYLTISENSKKRNKFTGV
jgi:hypothetical protein